MQYQDHLKELFKRHPEKITKLNLKGKIALGNKINLKKESDAQTIAIQVDKLPFGTQRTWSHLRVMYAYPNKGSVKDGIRSMKVGEEWTILDSDYNSDFYEQTADTYAEREEMDGATCIIKGTFSDRKSRIMGSYKILDVVLKISSIKGIYRLRIKDGEGFISRIK